MSPAPAADLVAALNADSKGFVISFLSMTDLSEKGRVVLEKGQKTAAFGLNPEGTRLAVLLKAVKDDSEPTVKERPKDLKGLDAEKFKLKNDGQTSLFMLFEVPTGKKLAEHKVYYSPGASGWIVLFQGEKAVFANHNNLNAVIGPDGAVTMFQLDNSFNYGLGRSADQKVLMSGGLANGAYTEVDGLNQTKFQIDKLPGWPEYFQGFAVHGDGTAYGGASAYRVIKILKGGKVDQSVPIF